MTKAIDHLLERASHAQQRDDLELAAAHLLQVLEIEPNEPSAVGRLGQVRHQQGQALTARALAFLAYREDSNDIRSRELWAKCHSSNSNTQQQIRENWLRVLDLDPTNRMAISQLGQLYFEVCDFENALPYCQRQLALNNANPNAQLAVAKCLLNLRRLDEASVYFNNAVSLSNAPEVMWEHAMYSLLVGDFDYGWQAYEARLDAFDPISSGRLTYPFPFPLWQGESLAGKTILVHGEQGLGDEIMFASMLQDLVEQQTQVVFATGTGLLNIMRRSFPQIDCIAHDRTDHARITWQAGGQASCMPDLPPSVDYQCPIGSLGQYLRPDFDAFKPKANVYLKPDISITDEYRAEFIARKSKFEGQTIYIGIAWSGNRNTGTMGDFKSIDIETLKPLFDDAELAASKNEARVCFISLHNQDHSDDLKRLAKSSIEDFSNQLNSFDETAALISACDWVISVDTSICHLAAALGAETWVPLRYAADWRYLHGLDYCQWYRNMKLFRQHRDGDWSQVIKELSLATQDKIRAKTSTL